MNHFTTAQAEAMNAQLAAAGFGPLENVGTDYDGGDEPVNSFASYPGDGAFGVWGSVNGWRVVHAEDGTDYDEMAGRLDFDAALAKAVRLNADTV